MSQKDGIKVWDRINVPIRRRIGNLKKTYIGDHQMLMVHTSDLQCMSPVSPILHTVVTVSIVLKSAVRMITSNSLRLAAPTIPII